jgi:hypothetical protein
MTTRTRRVYVIAALALIAAETAAAQPSRFEVSGGYQTTRVADQTLPIGWSADIATNLNRIWSVVGEVSGAYRIEQDEDLGVDVKLSVHSLGTGARWSRRVAPRFVPFLQVLVGAARISAHTEILNTRVGDSSTKFMLQPGGGVNLKMNETLGVVGQVDYRRVFVDEQDAGETGQNQFRAFVGVRIGL